MQKTPAYQQLPPENPPPYNPNNMPPMPNYYQVSPPPYNNYPPAPGSFPPPRVITAMPFGSQPQRHICQYCNHEGITRVEKESGMGTWLAVGGCLLFGCWFGCCLIPFYLDDLKDSLHHCTNCNFVVGIRRSFERS